MEIKLWINDKLFQDDVDADMLLIDYVRSKGFFSVKRGCETANCVFFIVNFFLKPFFSCSTFVMKENGKKVTTLEGLKEEAEEFGNFMADQGAEQCGFCSPGFVMNVLAMKKELKNPTEDEIKHYLAGNLCRCTGYMSQLRAIKNFLEAKRED